MTSNENANGEKHLRVYADRSEFHSDMGAIEIFPEGAMSSQSKARIKKIKDTLRDGYLDSIIVNLKEGKASPNVENIR